MFNSEVRELLISVIRSWQVLGVTIVLILYFTLINYIGKNHPRRQGKKKLKPLKKQEAVKAPAAEDSDELELEEKSE